MRYRVSGIVNTQLIERVLLFAGLHLNQSMCVERMRREALEALAPEDGGRLLADLGAARRLAAPWSVAYFDFFFAAARFQVRTRRCSGSSVTGQGQVRYKVSVRDEWLAITGVH